MSKLTECKDCGMLVSKRAKTCPHCGVRKPGVKPTNFGRLFLIALVIFIAGTVYVNQLDLPDSPNGQNVSASIARGDVKGSSIWFSIEDDSKHYESDDKLIWTLRKLRLAELGPVVRPAYDPLRQNCEVTKTKLKTERFAITLALC